MTSDCFNGAYRSQDSRLPLREIKITRSSLRFEGYRWVDLLEIYPFDPSNSLAFDFRQRTFAHSRSKNTQGRPPWAHETLQFWIPCAFSMYFHGSKLTDFQMGTSSRDISIRPLAPLRLRLSAKHFCTSPLQLMGRPYRDLSIRPLESPRIYIPPDGYIFSRVAPQVNVLCGTSSPLWRVPLTRTLYFLKSNSH